MTYIKRNLREALKKYVKIFPATMVTGPRQSGKSTFLQNELKDYTFVTFDDYKIISFFKEDPEGFFLKYNTKIIFDEVQKVPEIFNFLKKYIDEDRTNYGKFVLSGSNQFTMMEKVSESLAGRIGLLKLFPFERNEIKKNLQPLSEYKGSYPELVKRDYVGLNEWYSSYIDTYLNKDVKQIAKIGDIRDFQRFIELLAANVSQVLNMTTYSKELGVSTTTIKRWLSILEASYIIFLLPPFYNNLKKRVIKSPKVYFYDMGLISYITGIETQKQYEFSILSGPSFENYIISEVYKKFAHLNLGSKLYYLRTSNQEEIDLIIDTKKQVTLVEIKKTSTSNIKMFSTIKKFIKDEERGYLVYKGSDYKYSDSLNAINYKNFLESIS